MMEKNNNKKQLEIKDSKKIIDKLLKDGHFTEYSLKKIETGFANLDLKSGGISPNRVHILVAESSLGKSTFALQMATQIAAKKTDVLFFSLEQSAEEMLSKSISMIMKNKDFNSEIPSAKEIRNTDLSSLEGENPKAIEWKIKDSLIKYSNTIAEHLYFSQPLFSLTVEDIEKNIKDFMEVKKRDKAPLIFIDYIQLLDASNRYYNDKQSADHIIKYLKYLTIKYNTSVIAISSVNRQSYRSAITTDSIKESGGLEFGADIIWAMQLKAITDLGNDDKKSTLTAEEYRSARAETPRQVDLVCLKNRGGQADWNVGFEYFPKNDYFLNRRGGF